VTQPVAGWTPDDMQRSFSSSYGLGADDDLPDELRFARGVAELARLRHLRGDRSATQPTVFLLHPKSPVTGLDSRAVSERVPMLDEGDHPIAGRVWLVNQVVNDGVFVDLLPDEGRSEVFEFICAEPACAEVPAVVLIMDDDKLVARFYPSGLADRANVFRSELDGGTLPCSDVLDVVDQIWLSELVTPEAQGQVITTWEDAVNLIPVRRPEGVVQKLVKTGLTARYAGAFNVHQELTSEAGRFDLLIEQQNPQDRSQITRHVLLELKVLKDNTSKGSPVASSKNKTAIKKGIRQAATYRDSWNVRAAALCCFDMREQVLGDGAFEGFEQKALMRSVELWVRHIYGSSEKYREHLDLVAEAENGDSN
jgi:hypothetical protein